MLEAIYNLSFCFGKPKVYIMLYIHVVVKHVILLSVSEQTIVLLYYVSCQPLCLNVEEYKSCYLLSTFTTLYTE